MKRLWTVLLFLTAGPLRAGDLSFEATVDRDTLTMNDSLTLQLSISGAGLSVSRPELPSLPGFRAVFAGQSQNVSFVNGTVSNQVVYTYALEPQAPGEYTLPSLTMEAGGQKASSSPIKIKVLSAGAAPAPRTGGGPAPSD
ncbi:MAG TPA: BatD family protein, partial [Elusimicrobiota bacterium]|nr:BatD family protein [Elusimicrobiota bacterium]